MDVLVTFSEELEEEMAFRDQVTAFRRERQTLSVGCRPQTENGSIVTSRRQTSGGVGSRVTARACTSKVQLELSIE